MKKKPTQFSIAGLVIFVLSLSTAAFADDQGCDATLNTPISSCGDDSCQIGSYLPTTIKTSQKTGGALFHGWKLYQPQGPKAFKTAACLLGSTIEIGGHLCGPNGEGHWKQEGNLIHCVK